MGQYVRTLGLGPVANDQGDISTLTGGPSLTTRRVSLPSGCWSLRKKTGACASWVKIPRCHSIALHAAQAARLELECIVAHMIHTPHKAIGAKTNRFFTLHSL